MLINKPTPVLDFTQDVFAALRFVVLEVRSFLLGCTALLAMTFERLHPVYVDCVIWVTIGTFTAIYGSVSTEDAFKYYGTASELWWAKLKCAAWLGGLTAFKMFRSTSYAKYLTDQKDGPATPA